MNFALFGDSEEALALADAVQRHPGHQLVAVCGHPPDAAGRFPAAQSYSDGKALLSQCEFDAAIFGWNRVDENETRQRRESVLRELAQMPTAVIVVHPACEPLVAFEIDMIRQDSGCVLVPYWPGVLHPALSEVARVTKPGSGAAISDIEQVIFERRAADRGKELVMCQFTRDVAMLRAVIGEMEQVMAAGPEPAATNFGNLNVNMRSEAGIPVRWSLSMNRDAPAQMLITGTDGQIELVMTNDPQQWALSSSAAGVAGNSSWDFRGADLAIARLEAAVAGAVTTPSWTDVCRDLEIVDAVHRSLERGRKIDLYHETHSEASTFKGVMAAGGCLLLMLAFFMLLAAAAIEGLRLPFRHHFLWRIWPVYLVAPFVVFLLLQSLRLVVSSGKDRP